MEAKIEAIMEWLNMDWLLPANKKDQQLARQILQDLLPEAVKSNPVEIAKEMTKDISWYDNPNEVEIKDWDNYKICKCKYRWIIYWDKFCSQCWKKIKRVE